MLTAKGDIINVKTVNSLIKAIKKEIPLLTNLNFPYHNEIIFSTNHFEFFKKTNMLELKMSGILSNIKQDDMYDCFEFKMKSEKKENEESEYLELDILMLNAKYTADRMNEEISKFKKIYDLFNDPKFFNYKCKIIINNNVMIINIFEGRENFDNLVAVLEFKI